MTPSTSTTALLVLLISLGCAGAAPGAGPESPSPRCGPGGPAGSRCGPPSTPVDPPPVPPPSDPIAPIIPLGVRSVVSVDGADGFTRAIVLADERAGPTLIVERLAGGGTPELVGQQVIAFTDGGLGRGDTVDAIRWDGTSLRFVVDGTGDQLICEVPDALTGATAARCVRARGGRPR
jgi:hypothetical protein